jgi:hypothetical protein
VFAPLSEIIASEAHNKDEQFLFWSRKNMFLVSKKLSEKRRFFVVVWETNRKTRMHFTEKIPTNT